MDNSNLGQMLNIFQPLFGSIVWNFKLEMLL